nr:transposase [Serratia fonticola]
MGDSSDFQNGRHFAHYLGLVPKEHSSCGKVRLLGITKRGDGYLRGLLADFCQLAASKDKECDRQPPQYV